MRGANNKMYIRKTAIESVKNLLKNLSEHDEYPCDAIRMIDRTIGGLLAHEESPFYHDYRNHAGVLFPSGLEATKPGHDIILVLNKINASILIAGKKQPVVIPPRLKNPEKGVAQIIGHHLARALFIARGRILTRIIATEENGETWRVNAIANDAAQNVLKDYNPYSSMFNKQVSTPPLPETTPWYKTLLNCIHGG